MTERFPKWREGAAGALLAMAFVGLGIRLALLHLGPNERLRNRVSATRRVEQELQVGRGRIFDCNGQVLAMDLTVNDVCVDPSAILKEGYQHFIARQLSRLLSLEPAVVLQRIDRPGRQFEYIRRGVPDDEIRPVQALRIPSRMVWFEPISQRHYPQGALGCHVIGFTNLEGLGSAGVEQVHHDYLRGMPGLRISEQDGRGRERLDRRSLEVQGRQGADVHLTIDSRLQEMVEAELDRAMASTRAAAAWAIVQRVATGEILAMVSRPAYDLNAFRSSTEESRR
ncbi:MAG: hypothetical protein U1E27_00480, partial [Kiritimatiellia bacterium]|nr:hypothetical protein [Kiritimatiellia bacterium]